MKREIVQKLAELANSLDARGLRKEADFVDRAIKIASNLEWEDFGAWPVNNPTWVAKTAELTYYVALHYFNEHMKREKDTKNDNWTWTITRPGEKNAIEKGEALKTKEEAMAAAEAAGKKYLASQKS